MSAFFSLFFLGWIFGSHHAPEPKCPPLHQEVVSLYSKDEKEIRALAERNGDVFEYDGHIFWMASRTMTWAGEDLGVQIGTTTDTEAVAYNKRVRECQTLNGEFTKP